MKLTLIGTSSGTPTKLRNVSGYAIGDEQSKDWFLIDCGEGTQHQLLHLPLSLKTLRAIFITHVHGDHCYGLPGLLASASLTGRTDSLLVVAPKGVEEFFRSVCEHTQLYIPYEITFMRPKEGDYVPVSKNTSVRPIRLSHRVESFAYQFTEQNIRANLDATKLAAMNIPKGPLWGQLQRGEVVTLENGETINGADFLSEPRRSRSIIVSGDNDTPALLGDACKSADVLVHEATYTEEILQKVGPGPQHCSARRLAMFAEDVGIKNLVLTHFSPRFSDGDDAEFPIAMITEEARACYSGNLVTGEDLNSYQLTRANEFVEA